MSVGYITLGIIVGFILAVLFPWALLRKLEHQAEGKDDRMHVNFMTKPDGMLDVELRARRASRTLSYAVLNRAMHGFDTA